jgi:hypothetical protein
MLIWRRRNIEWHTCPYGRPVTSRLVSQSYILNIQTRGPGASIERRSSACSEDPPPPAWAHAEKSAGRRARYSAFSAFSVSSGSAMRRSHICWDKWGGGIGRQVQVEPSRKDGTGYDKVRETA